MANYGTYNFADHKKNTTFNEVEFVFSDHPSGTLSNVSLTTNKGNRLDVGGGITITDAVNWTFKIDAQQINWNKGNNTYVITTTSSHGVVKDFIRGTWNII